MRIKNSVLALIIIAALLIGSGSTFAITKLLKGQGIGTVSIPTKEYSQLKEMEGQYAKLAELRRYIEDNYYGKLNAADLEAGVYRGLFSGLKDPYSNYMTKEEYQGWRASTLGAFDGVGITFHKDDNNRFIVVSTSKNGPAEKNGVKAGDELLTVNGKTFTNSEKMATALRGKAGTKVVLTYRRDGKDISVTLTRSKIITTSVTTDIMDGNIGYIKISAFEEATDNDFAKTLADMQTKGVKGLIIDIRDNGGGLVASGANIADMLIGKGTITYLEDKHGKRQYIYSKERKTNLPYVVLVNENSASTSEILAAAVKDNGPGKLVGTKTFGKGLVQTTRQLSDGSAVKLTISGYFSPNGDVIHEKGVEPNYKVTGAEAQLKKALEIVKGLVK